jgi:nicotinate-nucleotide adenylyltransferase
VPRLLAFSRRPRSIALFGGSFDPVHAGHLAVARAAQRRFRLDEIHFVPSGRPPHKSKRKLAPFPHRYAMVVLACAENPRFIASLAEAGEDYSGQQVFYSIDTVRHFRQHLCRSDDRLFFLVGVDAFLEVRTWKSHKALLESCDFIVASRPGFSLGVLRRAISPELLGPGAGADQRTIPLRHSSVRLLDCVSSRVSATEIRRRCRRGLSIHGLVPARVEQYIVKQAVYR